MPGQSQNYRKGYSDSQKYNIVIKINPVHVNDAMVYSWIYNLHFSIFLHLGTCHASNMILGI